MGQHQPSSSCAALLIPRTGWHLTFSSWMPRRLGSSGSVRHTTQHQSAVRHCLSVAPLCFQMTLYTAHHETPCRPCGAQLLHSASSVMFCLKITDWWSTAHHCPCVYRKSHWLLQRCRWLRRPTIAVSFECCHAADQWSPSTDAIRAHHTGTAWHSPLAADITVHHLQNCADDVQSTLVMYTLVYTLSLLICDCDQPTMVTSFHIHSPLGLAAAVSACADQQFDKLPQDLWSTVHRH